MLEAAERYLASGCAGAARVFGLDKCRLAQN
jgi:hypothetical protein